MNPVGHQSDALADKERKRSRALANQALDRLASLNDPGRKPFKTPDIGNLTVAGWYRDFVTSFIACQINERYPFEASLALLRRADAILGPSCVPMKVIAPSFRELAVYDRKNLHVSPGVEQSVESFHLASLRSMVKSDDPRVSTPAWE